MAMQPRPVASAAMKIRAITSILTKNFFYNQTATQYNSSITYNFSISSGIMSEHIVLTATMKGR